MKEKITREIVSLNQGWRFCLGAKPSSEMETVCLPHTVSLTPAISSGCLNYQGKCCYEKEILIPKECENKKIILEFEGAMGVTELFVNGSLQKTHFCGYIPLVADVTEELKPGLNRLLLILDNSDNGDVPPGKSQGDLDFTYDGGLYREARMIVSDKLYISHPLLANQVAGGGVFVWTEEVSKESAKVNVQVHVQNESDQEAFCLNLVLKDKDGKLVAQTQIEETLPHGQNKHVKGCLNVINPQLWGPESPNLYLLSTELIYEGQVKDHVHTTVGIRNFEFTFDKELIFNGESMRISGANYHQTYPYVGNAVPNGLLKRDLLKLSQIGMRNIRSHYPFSTSFVESCNTLGITLIVSAPGWQWFKEGAFVEQAYQNVRDMIRWQRNHPCILLWEPILNETPMPAAFQEKVQAIVHEEYPYAPCYTASDHGPTDISYREYDPGMLEPGMVGYDPTKRFGTKGDYPVWIREYGDAPDNWTDQSCAWRVPRGWGDFAMQRSVDRMLGLDPQCSTNHYLNMVNKPNICGFGIWPGIEHNRGYHINPCWGGFLDLFRVPKFSYYFMKSQQPVEKVGPVLYIANWWMEISPDDVVIYSNADTVRLYHNDVLVAEQKADPLAVPFPPFTFRAVRSRFKSRERSVLKAEALLHERVVATEYRKSPGVPVSLKLEADFMDVPLYADGADLLLIYCKVVDGDGNLVPLTGDRHPVLFSVEGEGALVGDWRIGANPVCAEAGIASILVRSTKQAGEIRVGAEMFYHSTNKRIAIQGDSIVFASSHV